MWNLARLAEALLPLMAAGGDEAAVDQAVAEATAVINAIPSQIEHALLAGQRAKLGLQRADAGDDAPDRALVADWLGLLQQHQVDFTLAWRHLADAAAGDAQPLRALFAQAPEAIDPWLQRWQARAASEAGTEAGSDAATRQGLALAGHLSKVNPWVIPRNHLVEAALQAATEQDDLVPFQRLLAALRQPFASGSGQATYAQPAPPQFSAGYQTFCGT